jgi:hypothetical protein
MSSLHVPELKGSIFRSFGLLRVSVGGQQHRITLVQEGILCTGLLVILFNYWEYRGRGDTKVKIRQVEVTENSFFYCIRVT